MIRKPNPKLIGAFVTLSGVIFVALIMYLSADRMSKGAQRYLMFFDQSVNGLEVGSSVKYRGVPIGSVERIMIHVDGQRPESNAIPIIISIDHDRLVRNFIDPNVVVEEESMADLVDRGLVARLNLDSLITGQLFIDLSYERANSVRARSHMLEGSGGLDEIPTVGSSLHQITEDVAEVIAKITELDFEGIVNNTNDVLIDLEAQVENLNTAGVSESIVAAAQRIDEFVKSDELGKTLRELRESMEVMNHTVKTYNMENGEFGKKMDRLLASVTHSLDNFDTLITQTSDVMKPGSTMRVEMGLALRELRRTAQSIRLLTDYIERNPNALLTGRPKDD